MGFSREQLEAGRDRTVDDLLGPNTKLLFVGINPGLWTVAAQTHFSHPGNRFYPALRAAGIIDRDIDRSAGMTEEDRAYFIGRGVGITNVVERATAKASELSSHELRAGAIRLSELVAAIQPQVVAVAGITAYRTAFRKPKAQMGMQPEPISGVPTWAVPNPSGLNAHETTDSLALAYAEPARMAGLI